MPKGKPSRRKLADIDEVTASPPDSLSDTQFIARVQKATGNNLYIVETAGNDELLVELRQIFRSSVWLRRNGFVLIDRETSAVRDNKIEGEIVNVVRNERAWTKMPYWPKEFLKSDMSDLDDENVLGDDENDSTT